MGMDTTTLDTDLSLDKYRDLSRETSLLKTTPGFFSFEGGRYIEVLYGYIAYSYRVIHGNNTA